MKNHQIIFEKTYSLLQKCFGDKLNIHVDNYADGYTDTHLSVSEYDIWISCDDKEITLGHGANHKHLNPEYDDIYKGISEFFDLLTKRKRITKLYKGSTCFSIKTEIEIDTGKYKTLGTSTFLFYPFWKKTTKQVEVEERIIELKEFEKQIEEIKSYAQQ